MRKLFIIISIVTVAGTLPFIILAFFNQPVDDDYWYTWMAKEYGAWGAVSKWAATINGRYSSNAFMSLFNSLIYGSVVGFKIMPLFILLLWILVIKKYTDYLFANVLLGWQRFSFASLCAMVYYWNIPGINDGLYWVSAVVCYQLPLLLFAWLFLRLLRYEQCKKSFISGAGIYIAAVIAGGFHEMVAFMAGMLGLVYAAFHWLRHKKMPFWGLMFFCGAFTSLLVQVMSVGNHAKAELIQPAGVHIYWFELLRIVVLQTLYQMTVRVLLSPSFWLLAALLFYVSNTYRASLKLGFTIFSKKEIFAYWLLLLAACFFPALLMAVVAGDKMPPRVSNITYFVFLTGSLAGIFLMVTAFPQHLWQQSIYNVLAKRKLIVLLLVVIAAMVARSFRYAVTDIFTGSAYAYSQEINTRLSLLENCKDSACVISPVIHQPVTLYRPNTDASGNILYLRHLEKVYGKNITVIK